MTRTQRLTHLLKAAATVALVVVPVLIVFDVVARFVRPLFPYAQHMQIMQTEAAVVGVVYGLIFWWEATQDSASYLERERDNYEGRILVRGRNRNARGKLAVQALFLFIGVITITVDHPIPVTPWQMRSIRSSLMAATFILLWMGYAAAQDRRELRRYEALRQRRRDDPHLAPPSEPDAA